MWRTRGICHHCQATLSWVLSSPQPTDPILPLLAAQESGCQLLRWLRWGLVFAPHRGDTGYSAEKAAALPPAQLSNCHQQWPPRLAFSIYFPESQLSSLSTMDLFSRSTLASICSEQAPCTQASSPIQTLPPWTFRSPRS